MNREELLKNAKPILFKQEMVQAILEGRKTVTRRVLKKQPIYEKNSAYMGGGVYRFEHYGFDLSKDWTNINLAKSEGKNIPFEVGDILWVRETWNICNMNYEDNAITFIYKADKSEEESAIRTIVTDKSFEKYERSMAENNSEWRPSIHMPRSAARIFLKIKDIRVERLQDITEEQCLKEGCKAKVISSYMGQLPFSNEENFQLANRLAFQNIWDSAIKKQDLDKYSWNANPWVWVIEFERVEVENG